MANFFIVEGPDGAGKTTLVQHLQRVHTDAVVLHFGAPVDVEAAKNYWKTYAAAITKYAAENKTVIFDRSWLSDMVYGPIMRGREEMPLEQAEMLNALVIAAGGGVVIYCTASQSTLWRRCKARGEDYIKDAETLSRIAKAYGDIMHNVKYLPVIRYDTGSQW